jgi:hypothetical protein
MQRTDFPWGYAPAPHPQPHPMPLPQQPGVPAVGLMAPAAWGAPPPPGVIGLGPPVYKTSPLGTHTDLPLLEHGIEPTFQDEMATLFTSDTLLFSDAAVEEELPKGSIAAGTGTGVLDLPAAPMGMPGIGGLPGLPPHPSQAMNLHHHHRPLAGSAPPPLGVSSAAALAIALAGAPLTSQLTGGIPTAGSGLLGPLDESAKLAEEVSGSGSGEASADGFVLPLLSTEHASASPIKSVIGSEVDLKRIVDEVEESSSDEEEDDRIPSVLNQQQQQRLRLATSPRAGGAPVGGFAGRPTPLSSSGHSGGRLSQQPSTTALGKRSAPELQLAEKRGGTRRRIPSKRAVAATLAETSDDEDDLQYRSARRAYGNGALGVAGRVGGAAGGGPARTSTRLQGRPSGFRLDSDYVTYDELEEPSSPLRGSNGIHGAAVGGHQRRGGAGLGNVRAGNGTRMNSAVAPATIASGRRAAPSRAGRRTVPLAAQRIRATSARHELKGRPSFAEIVEAGFMRPGPHRFNVGNVEVAAAVGEDGAIMYGGTRYRAISKFALVVLRERNPTRQSCDGWKEVAWNGEKLDALRVRVQAHARQVARQRIIQ